MLVFDTAYTMKILQERNLSSMVTSRDYDGYFDHVWTVHPVASILLPLDSPAAYGRPETYDLAPRHTFIEGKIGRFHRLRGFPKLNFLLAQIGLLTLLFRLMRRNSIRLMRSEEIWICGPVALLLSWWFRVPLLVGVWGNPGVVRRQTGRPITPRLYRTIAQEEKVEAFVLRHADMVMVQNEDNRNFCLSAGVPHERTAIFRLGNAIEREHFQLPGERPDATADLAELGVDGGRALLCISRLEALKLTDHAVRVVKHLKDEGRDVVLLLAGDGTQRNELEALAVELDVADRVRFIGNRDQNWLFRVVPHVAVVLSPLTGRALGEAALGGAPIVAYDIDWHGELIETGVTGELVPHLDHEAMAAATARFLDNPEYARAMGAAVRRRALDMLDPEQANHNQIAVFEELMARRWV